jgi:prephenate dehydrogenase
MGGSFALACREIIPQSQIIGWDKASVLPRAAERGAIVSGSENLRDALADADLVYLALPLAATMEVLPEVAKHACPGALVTDACSTKVMLCRQAESLFESGPRFLGGHPMSGKEKKGVEHADAAILRGARYALIAAPDDSDPRVQAFANLLTQIGAQPVWLDPATHDRAVAIVSHLPQVTALALAQVVRDESEESGLPVSLAGPGLRDALRLAGSSYSSWRDTCHTNAENIRRALDRLMQALDHLRVNLTNRELEEIFRTANELYEQTREVQ